MDQDVERLADAMQKLARYLAAHGEPTWAEWIATDAGRVRRGDGYGVTHFLSAFGGVGSLNDLVLQPAEADKAAEGTSDLQKRFTRLRAAAWDQANALRHEAE